MHACENCGFSFCNKCLCMKCVVPKLGSEQRVCRTCYSALTERDRKPAVEKQYSPPSAFLRRLESLEDPNRPPIVVYQHNQRMEQLKTGLEEPDRLIAERLEKLRDDVRRKPVPTEEEVARRLAQLRGQPSFAGDKAGLAVDSRTDQERAENLVEQFLEERELAARLPDPDQEIASRLAELRVSAERKPGRQSSGGGDNPRLETASLGEVTALLLQVQNEMKDEDESDVESTNKHCLKEMLSKLEAKHSEISGAVDSDEEKQVREIISWAMAEGQLNEDEMSSEDGMSTSSENLPDEVRLCIICDKDATLKCTGCSGDTYCNDCFFKGHEQWGMMDHVAVKYDPQAE
ncbi:abscission/NoCut checkpoint regulator isoform X2 [Bacillus rossius redtenbacheri]|uniref:abscission/NoCut checkpoint regulator isoform X2 n=1 Tax=Bacillus rossius redtenbacheri TaxID=93214 RepID=UPI002FDF0502